MILTCIPVTQAQAAKTSKLSKFSFIHSFSEGLASVWINQLYSFIDKTGKVVVKLKYTNGGYFSDELTLVYKNDTPYFINKKGKVVLK